MPTKNRDNTTIETSSGNVFADLNLPNPNECLIKAKLAIQINKLLKKKKYSQKEAAACLKLDQPKISALSNGRLSGFSIERLFRLLTLLNQDIDIIIKPHKTTPKHLFPEIHVRA